MLLCEEDSPSVQDVTLIHCLHATPGSRISPGVTVYILLPCLLISLISRPVLNVLTWMCLT